MSRLHPWTHAKRRDQRVVCGLRAIDGIGDEWRSQVLSRYIRIRQAKSSDGTLLSQLRGNQVGDHVNVEG